MQAASIIAVGTWRFDCTVCVSAVRERERERERERGGRPASSSLELVRKLRGGKERRGDGVGSTSLHRGTFAPLVSPSSRSALPSNCLSEFDNGPSRPCKIHERARTL